MEIYSIIDSIIKSFKKHLQNNDYLGLLTDGVALLEYISPLIELSVTSEAEYRKAEATLVDGKDENGKRNTSSYAEVHAKATQYYADWQKARQVIELCYELSAMAKKLMGSIDGELKAH